MNVKPCEPDCQGFADYAAVPCPNPACDDCVAARWGYSPGGMGKENAAVDPEALPPALDVAQAALLLGVSRTKAYELIRTDEWPTPVFRVGRLLKIPKAPLLALLGVDAVPTPQAEVKIERPMDVRRPRVSDVVVLEQAAAVLAALGRDWLAVAVRDAIAGLGPTAPVEHPKDQGEIRRTPWTRGRS